MKGKFIVIEGLEGAGKSSAIACIKALISARGIDVVTTREPGGTPMAEAIRECVKHPWQEDVAVETELMLMYAARAQLLNNVVWPALARGSWVIGDRHDWSSLAYQGGGREIPDAIIEPLRTITLKGFCADLTLYLDVDPAKGLQRAATRGALDRIELEKLSFFERTRARYLALAEADPNAVVIDSMQPMERVHRDVEQHINSFMDNHVPLA
ncbi:dTMP kinase [Aestuariibacter halophilus]|uniref:Thymidylate kinase n=1 Tax=Fluctibacter halophilus TaxID=226011 RepID=A0ABS8G4X7_9ALTE|nr:dTMP kinase [Aestuariibacter halophilus]MCC2615637.1 dTMP kinase [Aestuariibacter halophilus]